MPSVFPGALDNIPSNKLNSTVSATDHPDHHNLLADAVNAIEATLGAGLSNVVTSVGATAPITSTGGSAPTIGVTSAALTKTDDTNVTLTLGGSPNTSLLAATSLTLGWTGQLSPARGGTGVATATANTVFAGPTSGGAAAPSFRVLGTADIPTGINHNTLSNLTVGDVHTQYALLAGRSGGQTLIGGTASSNSLRLQATSAATPGTIILNEPDGEVAIGLTTASAKLHVKNNAIGANDAPTGDDDNGYTVANAPIQNAFFERGFVGLGTSYFTPKNRLDIKGGVAIGPNYAGTYASPSLDGLLVEGNVSIGTVTNGSRVNIRGSGTTSATSALNVANSTGTSILFARNDGNVGIGTVSPGAKLEIYDNSNGGIIHLTRDAGNLRGVLKFGRNNSGSYQNSGQIDVNASDNSANNGYVRFGATNNSGTLRYPFAATGTQAGLIVGNTWATDPTTYFPPSNGMIIEGNVGIGTTSFVADSFGTHKLSVYTTTNTGLQFGRFSNDNGGPIMSFIKSRNTTVGSNTVVLAGDRVGTIGFSAADGTGYDDIVQIGAEVDAVTSSTIMSGRLLFFTTDTTGTRRERMRIDDDGYVGIGTTSPSFELDVRANKDSGASISLTNSSSGTSANSYFSVASSNTVFNLYALSQNYTGIPSWQGKGVIYAGSSTNALAFIAAKSSAPAGVIQFLTGGLDLTNSQMTITTSGVGIGDTAPSAQLHVDQTSTTAAKPTLRLQQADLSEEFIRFDTTVGTGNPINTTAEGTYYGRVRVWVEGVGAKWISLHNA